MKQIAYGRVRRKMENGQTERHFTAPTQLTDPQGKEKKMKKLLDKYFRNPNAKKIMFIYSRKELIAMGRRSHFMARSPRQG